MRSSTALRCWCWHQTRWSHCPKTVSRSVFGKHSRTWAVLQTTRFATAREINEKFCTQMEAGPCRHYLLPACVLLISANTTLLSAAEVVHGKGSHYNMMQVASAA